MVIFADANYSTPMGVYSKETLSSSLYGGDNSSGYGYGGNATTTTAIPSFPFFETAIFAAVFATIGVVGIVGNSLVITAIASDAKMRKSAMNVLLLNLAVADASNLLVCIPDVTLRLLHSGWILPAAMCPAFRYLEVCFLYTSLLTQVAVCIERCFAITMPMKIRLLCSRRKSIFWALTLWTMSSVWAIPIAVWNVVLKDRKTGHVPLCVWRGNRRLIKIFRCSECLAFYFVPLVLIVVLYTKISLTLWSQNENLHETTTTTTTVTTELSGSVKKRNNSYRKKIRTATAANYESLRVRQNVVKMLIACICVYFVCYSPIQAIFIAETFFDKTFSNPNIFMSLNCFTYACSAGNPILYSIFSQKFRRKFAEILQCRRTRGAANPNMNSNNAVNPYVNSNNAVGGENMVDRKQSAVSYRRVQMLKRDSTVDK